MNQNLWLKYALYSFLGVLILMTVSGLMQNSMNDYGMSSTRMPMNNMNMQAQTQMPMQGFAGGMPMGGMNMQAPMQGMATSMGFAGEMSMNGMTVVYPFFNGGMMSVMPVNMGRSYTPVNNGIPINGVQVGGMAMNAMPMISIPMVSIPVNTVIAPMYGATMNSMVMPGLGFNSLPMTGM